MLVFSFFLPVHSPLQNPNANPRPTAQDLAGFWDLLQLSIEDISMKFDELYHLKANSWQLAETPEKKVSMGHFRAAFKTLSFQPSEWAVDS